jgi:gliding motility-associated-like protein
MKRNLLFLKLSIIIWIMTAMIATTQTNAQPCATNPVIVSVLTGSGICDFMQASAYAAVTGGTAPYTYSWTDDFNTPIGTTDWVYNLLPGNYYVTVTDGNGCIGTAMGSVVDIPINVYISATPLSNCNANDGALTATAVGMTAAGPYQWSNGANVPTITNLSPGTYCVTVTNISGCTASACYTLENNLTVDYSAATCGWCNGAITLPPPDSTAVEDVYLIYGANSTTQTYMAGTTVENLCPGVYQVQSISGAGGNCMGSVTIPNLDLDADANAAFNTSVGAGDDLTACVGQTIQFTALGEENLLLGWDFGEPTAIDNNSDLGAVAHTYNATGTYTVTLIAQGCYTLDTVQKTITVEQGQAPDITCISLQCPGDTVTYYTAMSCGNYLWSVTGATVLNGNIADSVTVVWGNAAEGIISLTVSNCGTTICNNTTTFTVPLLSNTIPIDGNEVVCSGDVTLYNLPSYGGVSYQWEIIPSSAGNIVNGQGSAQVAIAWGSGTDATILVSLSSVLLDCYPVVSLPVQVNVPYTISGDENVCANTLATYTASAGLHNWNVTGNAAIISGGVNSASVTIETQTSGTYTVSATPTDVNLYCDYPQSIVGNIIESPAVPTLSGEIIICPNQAYEYTVDLPSNDVVYEWSVVGGTPASSEGNTLWVTFDNSGIYSVAVHARLKTEPFCLSNNAVLNPTALSAITINGSLDVCAGDKTNYDATPVLDNVDYNWSISPANAGSVIVGQNTSNITVQWNSGFSAASLQVTACGATETIIIAIHNAALPTITPSGYLCAGSNIDLSISPAYNNYEWNTSATDPVLTINSGGDYSVTVTDNYACTAVGAINVHEYDLPDASISPSEYPVICIESPTNVPITALVNPNYSYQWFRNGVPVGTNSPIYTHIGNDVIGNTNYTAIITNAQGCVQNSNIVTVSQVDCIVNGGGGCSGSCPNPGSGAPVGCFAAPTDFIGLEAQEPYCNTVTFNNLSNGVSYVWDFGDGSPTESTVGNATTTHTYNYPGFYSVLLYGTFENTLSLPMFCTYSAVTVVEVPLVADFDYEKACLNSATQFNDLSLHTTGTAITSWLWDFGDGNTSTDTNPAHIYNNVGNYVVTLTISNGICNSVTTRNIIIETLPDANFNSPNSLCQYETADFTPLNTQNIVQYTWDFGNGSTVNTPNPSQSYLTDGNFDILLTITDNKGCTNTHTQNIDILPVGSGDITANNSTACVGETIVLTAPTGANYLWSDGSTNATLSVTNSGTYSVTVTQPNGCTFVPDAFALNFMPLPTAVISPDNTPFVFCPGQTQLFSADAGSNYSYAWSLGGSQPTINVNYNSFTAPHNLFVTVTNTQTGCSAVSAPIVLNKSTITPPTIAPFANVQLCEGGSSILTANHATLNNFVWNNGATTNSITVNEEGLYSVAVSDAYGCVANAQVTVSINTGLDMSLIPTGCYEYCENEPIVIPNEFMAYQWLYDGTPLSGATSNILNPTQSGDYQLIVYSMFGCADTSDLLSLTLIDCLPCNITANFSSLNSCNTVTFSNLSVGDNVVSNVWNFGDGTATQSSTGLSSIEHTYTTSGTYNVCLTAMNIAADQDTCYNTLCQDVTINAGNFMGINIDNITAADCNTANGAIDISLSNGTAPYIYNWSNGNTNQDLNNTNAGSYTVTVSDNSGCESTQTATIGTADLPPTSITCGEITDNSIEFNWTAVNNALEYELSITVGTLPAIVYTTNNTTYTLTDLLPETNVTVSIVVIAPTGCTNSAAAQTDCTTLPAPCNILETPLVQCLDMTENSITFEWQNVSNATGYTVQLTLNGTAQTPFDIASNSYTVSDLLPETEVIINVTALNTPDCDNSAIGIQSCSTLEAVIPPCPSLEIDLSGIETNYCIGNEMQTLTIIPAGGSFSGNGINSNTFNPTNAGGGQHTITYNYTETINGAVCQYDTTFVLNVSGITITNEVPDTINLPSSVFTIPVSINATSLLGTQLTYTWIENGNTICEGADCQTVSITPPYSTNNYTVIVSDEYGCEAIIQTVIVAKRDNELLVPNAFSPNNDGINDVFRIFGQNIAEYQLIIYDRVGYKVYDSYTSHDINMGWNGKRDNLDAELDVYAYHVLVTFDNGKQAMRKGNVTLVR